MSQGEIIDILEKEGKPISAKEIADQVGNTNSKSVFITLRILLEHHEIKCIEIDKEQARKLYNSYRRLRLYYIA
jgi:Fe2+ or Zn2+ uptake regulation protein